MEGTASSVPAPTKRRPPFFSLLCAKHAKRAPRLDQSRKESFQLFPDGDEADSGMGIFLQQIDLTVVRSAVAQEPASNLDQFGQAAPMAVQFRIGKPFDGAVAANGRDVTQQAITSNLAWDGAVIELKHDLMLGYQPEIIRVR
jgi:hypothetical protein